MKKKETQLHDKNFRRRIRILWLLRAFLKATLPKSTLKLLNLYKLQILDSQLVTPHSHRNLNTDFVCRVGLKGKDAFALLLIEHQSTADKMMPLRILRYAGELMDAHSDESKSERYCPLVIPIVFYTGQSAYRYFKALDGMISGKPKCDDSLIKSNFYLVTPKDLENSVEEDGEALSLFGQSFALAQNPDLSNLFKVMVRLDQLEGEKYVEFVQEIEEYLFKESECKLIESDRAKLRQLMTSTNGEREMPSLADIIHEIAEEVGVEKGIILGRQEGRQEGLAEGRQEGLAEGRQEGKVEGRQEGKVEGKREALLEVAKGMMSDSMDAGQVSEYTGLGMEAISKLAGVGHRLRLT